MVKYQKDKGISSHQAAAYVIARKGMGYKETVPSSIKCNDKKVINFIFKGKVIDSVIPVRTLHESSRNNFTLLKTLSNNVRESKKRHIEQLKKKVLAQVNNKNLNSRIGSMINPTDTAGYLPELDTINPDNLGLTIT